MGLKPSPTSPKKQTESGKGEMTFKIKTFGWNGWKVTLTLLILLLMEEIPNNQLGYIKTLSNHGFFLPTLTGGCRISAIKPSTVAPSFWSNAARSLVSLGRQGLSSRSFARLGSQTRSVKLPLENAQALYFPVFFFE